MKYLWYSEGLIDITGFLTNKSTSLRMYVLYLIPFLFFQICHVSQIHFVDFPGYIAWLPKFWKHDNQLLPSLHQNTAETFKVPQSITKQRQYECRPL